MTDATPRWYTCHCHAAVPDGAVWLHKLRRHNKLTDAICEWTYTAAAFYGVALGTALALVLWGIGG